MPQPELILNEPPYGYQALAWWPLRPRHAVPLICGTGLQQRRPDWPRALNRYHAAGLNRLGVSPCPLLSG